MRMYEDFKIHRNRTGRRGDLREDFKPRFHEIMTNAESQIAEMLTPEQRQRFEQMLEEHGKAWR